MKLTFSAASPFARKVRIAAIELGLIDKIEFTPATVAPGTANEDYSRITPLKKLPVLITNDGDVILDSYVIVEYLNEMAGGSLIPDYGPRRWKAKTNHSADQRHARFHAAVPLREDGATAGPAMAGVVGRPLEPGLDRHGALREHARRLERPVRHLADRPRLRARLCRLPLRRLRLAQGLSEARRLPPEDAGAALREDLGARPRRNGETAGRTTMRDQFASPQHSGA